MVVLDGDEVRRHERAVARVWIWRWHRACFCRNALQRIDAGRADTAIDFAGIVEDPIDHVVVIAELRRHAHHQLHRGPAFVSPVDDLEMTPDRLAGGALENTDRIGALNRLAAVVVEGRIRKMA